MLYDKESGIDWEKYYPPVDFERQEIRDWDRVPGAIYAFVNDDTGERAVGVFRQGNTEGDGVLLARSPAAKSGDPLHYACSSSYIVAIVREPDKSLRPPNEVYRKTTSFDWGLYLCDEESPLSSPSPDLVVGAVYTFGLERNGKIKSMVFGVTKRHGVSDYDYERLALRNFDASRLGRLSNASMVERCVLVRDEHGVFVGAKKKGTGRRQISHNGRDWVDYDTLSDSDAFDVYEFRRTLTSSGAVMGLVTPPAPVRFRCFHDKCKAQVGRDGESCFEHHQAAEKSVAADMAQRNAAFVPKVREVAPPRSSHATLFGGVWSLR